MSFNKRAALDLKAAFEKGDHKCTTCGAVRCYNSEKGTWHCFVCQARDFFTIDVICCECGRKYGEKHSLMDGPSHGFCNECHAEKMAELTV